MPQRITTALLATALVTATGPAGSSTAAATLAPLQSAETISWQDCPHRTIWSHPGLVCAEVTVPVDYQKPDGKKTTIWVGKKAATSGKAQGTIVTAASKYDAISQATDATESMLSPELLADYDVISIDQQGFSHDGSTRCFATGRDQDNVMSALAGTAL